MSRRGSRRFTILPATALLSAASVLCFAGSCSVRPAPAIAPPAVERPVGGSLFSAIPCAETPLGAEWSMLLGEAGARFPGLRLTRVEDLHITIVYLGEGWKRADLETIKAHALVGPREVVSLRPEVVRMGRNGQVVAVELHGAPEEWTASLGAAKGELSRLGLRKVEEYDAAFRPHVTLASPRRSPPDATEAAELDGLLSWLAAKLAAGEGRFGVTVGPETPVRLWLAGTARAPDAPAYVDLENARLRP